MEMNQALEVINTVNEEFSCGGFVETLEFVQGNYSCLDVETREAYDVVMGGVLHLMSPA